MPNTIPNNFRFRFPQRPSFELTHVMDLVKQNRKHIKRVNNKINRSFWSFGEPLDDSEIKGIETHNDIKLPEQYRNFLKLVGNGGPCSMDSGLYPIAVSLQKSSNRLNEVFDPLFPLIHKNISHNEVPGVLIIASDYVATSICLVVSGHYHGTIWVISEAGVHPYFSNWLELVNIFNWDADKIHDFIEQSDVEQVEFMDWYADWPYILT